MFATGGGAKSHSWLQIKADILNRPITSLLCSEAGTTGAAMLSGLAVGAFKNLDDAALILIKTGKTYFPDKRNHDTYKSYYQKYKSLYPAIESINRLN